MHILRAVLVRRLLACLALITGLAAVAAPASASLAEVLCCGSSVSAGASEDGGEQRGGCPEQDRVSPADAVSTDAKPLRNTTQPNRPPVLFGVDRAYE